MANPKNKTAVVISSIESLSTQLGHVLQDNGASVHILNVDISADTGIEMTNEKQEDFVLIYIR